MCSENTTKGVLCYTSRSVTKPVNIYEGGRGWGSEEFDCLTVKFT